MKKIILITIVLLGGSIFSFANSPINNKETLLSCDSRKSQFTIRKTIFPSTLQGRLLRYDKNTNELFKCLAIPYSSPPIADGFVTLYECHALKSNLFISVIAGGFTGRTSASIYSKQSTTHQNDVFEEELMCD